MSKPPKPQTPSVFTAEIVLTAEQVEEACKRYILSETGQTPIAAKINVGMVSTGYGLNERSDASFQNVTVKVGMKSANSDNQTETDTETPGKTPMYKFTARNGYDIFEEFTGYDSIDDALDAIDRLRSKGYSDFSEIEES